MAGVAGHVLQRISDAVHDQVAIQPASRSAFWPPFEAGTHPQSSAITAKYLTKRQRRVEPALERCRPQPAQTPRHLALAAQRAQRRGDPRRCPGSPRRAFRRADARARADRRLTTQLPRVLAWVGGMDGLYDLPDLPDLPAQPRQRARYWKT